MAVTTENSTQLAAASANPPVANDPRDWESPLRLLHFTFTQGAAAGDAGSIAQLVRLPPGQVRLIPSLSRISFSTLGASRTIDLGHAAYTSLDGTAVTADPDAIEADVDGASGGSAVPTTNDTLALDSRDGIVLTAQVNDGTLPAGATLSGHFVYVQV